MALREFGAGERDDDSHISDSAMVVLAAPHFLKRRSSPTSIGVASLFDGLTEEQLVEILRQLPQKFVTRCKSVSKNWLNLISSSHFAYCYRSFHSATPPQFAIIHRYRGIIGPDLFRETPSSSDSFVKLTLTPIPGEDILLPSDDPSEIEFHFLASSNGWVLCSYPDLPGEIYYVINPLTKHQITLPPIPRTSGNYCRVGFIFIAGDSNRYSNCSFRVVRFPPSDNFPDNNTLKLDIFSSETGHWTQSTLSFSSERSAKRTGSYDCPLNNHAIEFNGMLHWLHVWHDLEIFVYNPYEPEKYQRLRLPEDCLGMSRYCFGTCQSGGQQHLMYSEWDKGLIHVWELKDYSKVEWCLLHRVHVSEITSHVSGTPRFVWPPRLHSAIFHPDVVAFHPSDRDVLLCYYLCRFLKYNMRSKTLEVFLEQQRSNVSMTRTFFLFELPWWPTPVPSPCSN